MRKITIGLALALSLAGACAAQEWEVGGMASYGFYRNLDAVGSAGTALAGFSPGAAFGGVLGHNSTSSISGEFRYSYLANDLKLSSGGTTAHFGGTAGADLLFLGPEALRIGRVDDSALCHDVQLVGDHLGKLHILLDQEDGDTSITEEPNDARKLTYDKRREALARLVEK